MRCAWARSLQWVLRVFAGCVMRPGRGGALAARSPRAGTGGPPQARRAARPQAGLALRQRRQVRSVALASLSAALVGCAVPVALRETSAAGAIVVDTLELGAQPRAAHWYLPPGAAPALVIFEHGFARRCENLRETTRQLMAGGLMALCVDVPMARGNPGLAEALAQRLAAGLAAPDGRALPQRVVVAGHSAGAVFALALGARLEALAPGRLVGALLFDPVAPAAGALPPDPAEGSDGAPRAPAASLAATDAGAFEAALHAVSASGRRPVLALLAPPHRCNARSNALPALRRAERDARGVGGTGGTGDTGDTGGKGSPAFVIVQLEEGATHADVEGEDTDALATWVCGAVDPARSAALRARAVDWLRGVLASPPGGFR